LLALLPSRDTPQATRSSSSGTQRPKWPSTMASAAAPHSTASICNTVGVRTRRGGAVRRSGGTVEVRRKPVGVRGSRK
jgi:hypothetical protein